MRAALAMLVVIGACHRDDPRPAPRAPRAAAAPIAAASRATTSPAPDAAPSSAPSSALDAARARGHDALVRHCGECHRGRLATAKPAALAIFDLDATDWPAQLDARELDAALRRFASKPAPDQAAFRGFRDAELAAR